MAEPVALGIKPPQVMTLADMLGIARGAQAYQQAEQANPLELKRLQAEANVAAGTETPRITQAQEAAKTAQIGTNTAQLYVPFPVTMRTSPSSVTVSGNTTIIVNDTGLTGYAIPLALNETSCDGATLIGTTTSGTTAGYATTFYANNASVASIIFNAEL
jgi:hypothetical protein